MTNIIKLNTFDFQNGVLANPHVRKPFMVLFYTKHCDACKRAVPLYEKFAKLHPNLVCCKMEGIAANANPNAPLHMKLLKELYKAPFLGYPSYKLFSHGGEKNHAGVLTLAALEAFIA